VKFKLDENIGHRGGYANISRSEERMGRVTAVGRSSAFASMKDGAAQRHDTHLCCGSAGTYSMLQPVVLEERLAQGTPRESLTFVSATQGVDWLQATKRCQK